LGGATAQIHIIAGYEAIVLAGWAADEAVIQLAISLTRRAAGKRAVQTALCVKRGSANTMLTERILDDNRPQACN
ncbi:MAG: hypothetical protein KF832_23345, partial [Caldilineaceae bacterium]|nr:hypothetical protein [Caldilineaceae bacterium]